MKLVLNSAYYFDSFYCDKPASFVLCQINSLTVYRFANILGNKIFANCFLNLVAVCMTLNLFL